MTYIAKNIRISELHNADWNANRVPPEVLQKVRHSIKEFGVVENLVVRAHPSGSGYEVLSGNHRLTIFRELDMETAPVVVVDVDDAKARVLAQTLNRTRGQDDPEAYARLLDDVLKEMSIAEVVLFLPETADSIGRALDDLHRELDVSEEHDDVFQVPDDPDSVIGEVYELGPHRLVCGDSTNPEIIAAVLGDEAIDCVWTDPPYGVSYKAMRGGKPITNDSNASEAESVVRDALSIIQAPVWFVCCDWRSHRTILSALEMCGIEPKATIVWDKGSRVQNLDRFGKQHEFIVYSGPYGGNPTVDVDVWTIPRDFKPDHPTPKPIELIQRSLKHATSIGNIVYDPFGGSGSTLIAADTMGRRARLVELDPGYCDVIRRRYEKAKGNA